VVFFQLVLFDLSENQACGLLKISPGRYKGSQVTILWKIRGISPESFPGILGNSQESFTGKFCENVDRYSGENPVTHSEEFDSEISRGFILGFSPELVTRSSPELDSKISFVFWGTHSREIPESNSSEFVTGKSPENLSTFSPDFLRKLLRENLVKKFPGICYKNYV